jgi:hypothetical protein
MKMNFKNYSKLFLMLSLGIIIIISGCATPTPMEPTPDANMIFTQAAQTVQAQLTRTALAMPTSTPTATLEPTATELPVEPTATSEAAEQPTSVSTAVTNPTLSTAPNPNKMEFIADVTIPDDTVIAAGTKFIKTWKVKNVGSTTWTENYKIRHWAGDRLGAASVILLGKEAAPNQEIEISIEFTAPLTQGEYMSMWILSDKDEANFGVPFYVKIVVGNPSTATPTTAPATATTAPTTAVPATTEAPTATVTPTP